MDELTLAIVYVPAVLVVFMAVRIVIVVLAGNRGIQPSMCAQYAVSAAYMQVIIVARLLAATGLADAPALLRHCTALSLAYYVLDTLYILAFEYREQKTFVPHHLVAICMGYMTARGVLDGGIMSDYMFYIELSNVWLTPWDFCKRHRHTMPAFKWLYESLTPVLAHSYVPLRVLHLTVNSIALLAKLPPALHPAVRTAASACIVAIQLMSYYFSFRVARIYAGKRDPARYATHAALSGDKWWPVVTHVVSWYVQIHMLVHAAAPPLAVVNLACIVASCVYTCFDRAPWAETLAFVAIRGKILAIGVRLYVSGTSAGHAPWPWLWLVCLNAASFVIVLTAAAARSCLSCSRSSCSSITAYGIPIVTLIGPSLLYNYSHLVAAGCSLSIIGAAMWVFRIPERWYKSTPYNSLGWMHVAVMASDACVLHL